MTDFLLKAVELYDARVSQEDLDLEGLRCTTPLCTADITVIECEGVTAARWLPSESSLRKSAFARLLREVEVDVVKAFSIERGMSVCATLGILPIV